MISFLFFLFINFRYIFTTTRELSKHSTDNKVIHTFLFCAMKYCCCAILSSRKYAAYRFSSFIVPSLQSSPSQNHQKDLSFCCLQLLLESIPHGRFHGSAHPLNTSKNRIKKTLRLKLCSQNGIKVFSCRRFIFINIRWNVQFRFWLTSIWISSDEALSFCTSVLV